METVRDDVVTVRVTVGRREGDADVLFDDDDDCSGFDEVPRLSTVLDVSFFEVGGLSRVVDTVDV